MIIALKEIEDLLFVDKIRCSSLKACVFEKSMPGLIYIPNITLSIELSKGNLMLTSALHWCYSFAALTHKADQYR